MNIARWKKSTWVKLGCVVVLLINILMQPWLSVEHFSKDEIGYYRDLAGRFRVIAQISGEPDRRSDSQNLVVETQTIFLPTTAKAKMPMPIHGKILLKTPRYPEYFYGEILDFTCKLQTPPVFEKFSYAALLAKDDIFVFCTQPLIHEKQTALQPINAYQTFWSGVFGLKQMMIDRMNVLFAEPEASLAAGILIGQRRAIPQTILDDFNMAGLTHVLAISGYNVSMMMMVFGYLCRKAGRRSRLIWMLLGVGGLVVLTGFSSSVLRAAYMSFIALFAQAIGRRGSGLVLLLLSGVIMVCFSPRMILVDLSFQLSFLSTLGLLLFMPKIEIFQERLIQKKGFAWIEKIPTFMREGFLVTIAAQVFTTPLLLFQFGRFSLIAPIANIFVLPLVPWIMLLTFAGMVVSFLIFPLGQLMSFGAHVLIWLMLVLVEFFAKLPFASLQF